MQLQSPRAPWLDHCRTGASPSRQQLCPGAQPSLWGDGGPAALRLPAAARLATRAELHLPLRPGAGASWERPREHAANSTLHPRGSPRGARAKSRGPNGHLPRTPFNLEQAIGARLRHMGDRFHQDHEQRERRPRGALWAHLYHFVFHLLGILDNLPARG